ncbi:hypothetical protein BSS2_II0322 [Brucella suis bv. 1 str. S2]|uniref:Uncharacterized protein n=8 Tax=Brucella TaxID=234 RepID=A9ME87_BRUC2|nr:hypothetical protein BRA0337 [Brucella suis 1330]ABX63525.1 Hypothetical protein, conserved [Brucella canis ATCC 23365]ABY39349.1 Hypothetical protein, conserved [Brucella suis ATCC 23445]ACU49466.1 hypothetical protein BMI_II332 [Brucella microti CCM 4915]AEK55783.1 hypothetical protein BPI_II335 [Brucella pinnipedialis B2/94]AEU07486.1 hypothetical protein BSVBI22_B0333 [Brucella suis VBI22]AHN48085.1 hypothetical protein BSS2_II0322 [Brucella suis bv. 1 str. S2]EEX85415.1 predicted pro
MFVPDLCWSLNQKAAGRGENGVFRGMSDAKLWSTHIHTALRRFSPYKISPTNSFAIS